MQEVELTCEVTSEVQVRFQKKLAGQEPYHIVVNDDRYYDTNTGVLFEKAVFVRVRTTEASTRLQFKFDESESDKKHIRCTEREFDLSKGELPETVHDIFCYFLPQWEPVSTWQEACERNALQELTRIHNTRYLYRLGSLTICVDHIRELGTFVEAELICEDGADTLHAQHAVQQFVAAIGGTPLSAGYVELSLRRSRPELYLRGQYYL